MSERVRIYNLARELGLTNRELIDLLQEEGVEVRSHASTIEPDIAELIREHVITERLEENAAEKSIAEALQEAAQADDDNDDDDLEEDDEASDDDGDEDEDEGEDAAKELHLKPPITVRELAEALGRKPNELVGELMTMNIFAAINQVLEVELIEKVCERHGVTFVRERRAKAAKGRGAPKPKQPRHRPASAPGELRPRPPVVAFLGHVDHGKTSLQDYIRETHVTDGEAGGITQHIGASVVEWEGQLITFLDTPGHEAFTAMRARGANATDIVVLVVAADDGVMPQTKEAISHTKAAGVPMVVAMNKMDLQSANPDQVLLGLQQNEVMSEEWGGEVGVVPVSAETGDGIEDLLERLLLEAEMLELKADSGAPCEALVIESQLESGMGPTANVLVRNGALHVGDALLCGPYYGKAKALIDTHGDRVKSAGASMPVKVLGLSGVPEAGSMVEVCADEKEARAIAAERETEERQSDRAGPPQATLEDLFRQIEEEARAEVKLIIKSDVQGSMEAILDSITKIESDKVKINIIHNAVGEITENDVTLAAASDAVIIGFHVRAMPGVNRAAKHHGVDIRLYSIIYELLEDLKEAMRGQLEPEQRESALGEAEIIQVFEISTAGKICGSRVTGGLVRVGASARVYREDEVIYSGQIQNLKRFKDDVREVRSGLECGIRLDNFEDFEVGDVIRVYSVVEVQAEL